MKKIAIVLMTLALVGGTALAQRGPGGPGNGSHDGTGPKAELGQAVTATGTVVSFTAAAGEGQPTLVVRDSAGDHSFVLGPYRVIVAQGFAAEASNQVEVQGFVCTTCPTGVVVFQVKNLTT
ncbi:MAG TPA: hypothetical protein PLS53_14810, partial [Thermoanaerobaculaceae bacterium]|nr:hypothetical protein [Thermoanaerobaculaceae bacterium]